MFEENSIGKILKGELDDAHVRIVKASIEEFAVNSPECARIRKITDEAGVNVAAVNYYFGNKKNLYHTTVCELAEFMENFFAPYYKESDKIIEAENSAAARKFISHFIIDCIDKFSGSQMAVYIVMIYAREEIEQTTAFPKISKAMYRSPMNMLTKLMSVATKGKIDDTVCTVYAHSLWSNVRSYASQNLPLLKQHGWKKLGAPQIVVVKNALDTFLNKILK